MTWNTLDLVHYESRVLSKVGRWANFEDLESSLTLDELFILYKEVLDAEIRNLKATAKAFGAEGVELNFGPDEDTTESVENAFEGVLNKLSEKTGQDFLNNDERKFSSMKLGYNKR